MAVRRYGRFRLSVADIRDLLAERDVAFVRIDHLAPPAERIGYLRVVPDLVVEIRSPNDTDPDVQAKMDLYASAGDAEDVLELS